MICKKCKRAVFEKTIGRPDRCAICGTEIVQVPYDRVHVRAEELQADGWSKMEIDALVSCLADMAARSEK